MIEKLVEAGALIARGRLKHQYPHSWRSKAPADLPQHAAMVHRHGQAARRRMGGRPCVSARSHGHRDHTELGAGDRREPHHRHDREPPRLGGLAPARLGRADHRLRQARAPTKSCRTRRVNARIAEAFEQEGADAWFADDGSPLPAGRRLRPRTITRRSTTSSTSGSIPARTHAFALEKRDRISTADSARSMAGRDHGHVSRRLGPASRLVPLLAAGELRHARPRALRRRPHPRLRPRREGPEDVEVARQRDRAAGRDPAIPAPTSCASGWRRPTTPTICASARRS